MLSADYDDTDNITVRGFPVLASFDWYWSRPTEEIGIRLHCTQ